MLTTPPKVFQVTEELQNDKLLDRLLGSHITLYSKLTCSDVGVALGSVLFFAGRFRFAGELFGYLEFNKFAIYSDNFSS